MNASETRQLESFKRGVGLVDLGRLFPKTHPGLGDLADTLAAAFFNQFDAEPQEVRYYFALLKLARHLLDALCWPPPGTKDWLRRGINTWNAPLVLDASLRPRFNQLLDPVIAIEPGGILYFEKEKNVYRFLARALEWLAGNPPPRRATQNTTQEAEDAGETPALRRDEDAGKMPALRLADRLGELQTQWICDGRVRPLDAMVARLGERLPPGVTPLLFGSLAENAPWPAYADVDLALWLSREAWQDPGRLRAAAQALGSARPAWMRIDPLQHHGPYLFFDFEAAAYGESQLPLETLRRAIALRGGPLSLELAPPLDDRVLGLAALVGIIRASRGLAGNFRKLTDRYMAKYLASMVLLAPAAALGALGQPVEKSLSFMRIKERLSEPSRETLEGFERLRRDWHWSLGIPPWLLRVADGRAHFLSRNVNRWPSFKLAWRLRDLGRGLRPFFDELLGIVEGK